MPEYSDPNPVNPSDEQVPDIVPPQESLTTHPRQRNSLSLSVKPEALSPIETKEFLPSLSRWITFGSWFIVGVLGLSAAATTVVTYRTTVKTTATIRPTGEARLVQAGAEGTVTKIAVKNYQPVKKGQAIAYLDNSRLRTQADQLESNITKTQGQLKQIEAQLKALEQQKNAELLQIQRAIAASEAELTQAKRSFRDKQIVSTAEVEERLAQFNLAKNEVESYRLLVGNGAISKLKLAEKEAGLRTAQARLRKLEAGLNPSDAEVVAAQAKVAQEQSRKTATEAEFNRSRQQLIQDKLETQNQLNRDIKELKQVKKELENSTIRASITGILYGLKLRNVGQVLRSGDTIAQIIPSDTPLEIKAVVPSDRINRVKVGLPTQMQVSACPVSNFGSLPGKVKSISPDTMSTNTTDSGTETPAQISQPGYTVIVKPQKQILQTNQRTCELVPGAEGRLTIISKEETVLSFLMRKARLRTNF
ncbi:multidrug resistance efflux pump [Rivularia sp. PCC 7116]|uniref:HlyD family secretion protein n=1 Tax=Rivularia sp. PCC 7116 TaxID=373994 RepID=UPI00029F0F16|nr:HlyD family secretion protein [Rivularia sp. PCC 7116]AFY57522.1 multidrug resistance efflux pump [Rivularia sp. PCC 7116]